MWPFKKTSDFWEKKKAQINSAINSASEGAEFVLSEGDGFRTARYERNGGVDYEVYRRVQNEGNRAKLDRVFAKEHIIRQIAAHAHSRNDARRILCHGTRNGQELTWFAKYLPDSEILGTDIADSATQFPNTIQWDFHEMREDWASRWNVIYTNSWDHAMEPQRAIQAWADSLAPDGILYLEYTRKHGIDGAGSLDLFGATKNALRSMVSASGLQPLWPIGWLKSRSILPFQKKAP